MKLLFKQRVFSWFDSYDIYDESGNILFVVKGQLSWGHKLNIYNSLGEQVGTIKEEVLTFLPRFALYEQDRYIGQIKKEFSFFKPKFALDFNGWEVNGNWMEWDYTVYDQNGSSIMEANKKIFQWADTYEITVHDSINALYALMIVLAIDIVKCSN